MYDDFDEYEDYDFEDIGLYEHKRSDKVKWIISFLLIFVLLAGMIGAWVMLLKPENEAPQQEEEAAAGEGVQRIAVDRVFRQQPGVVPRPAGVAVEMTIRMIGSDLELEVLGSHYPAVVILVESTLFFDLFRGLGQLAFPEQTQTFGVVEFFRFRILVDVLNHHDVILPFPGWSVSPQWSGAFQLVPPEVFVRF